MTASIMMLDYPRIFNKKQLCQALQNCVFPNGDCNYKKLRKHYLTDEFLRKIGINPDSKMRVSLFTASQCRQIIKEFDLKPEDFL